MRPSLDLGVILAGLAAVAVTGMFATDYWIGFGISLMAAIALTQSWAILSAFSGYISLGHVVFYGLGAYLVVTTWNVIPLPLALMLAALIAAAFAFATGLPVLRVRGPYFVILTFGIAELVKYTLIAIEAALGHASRLILGAPDPIVIFYVLLGLAFIATLIAAGVRSNRLGHGLRALREDEIFDLIDRFATTAQLVEKAGFSGVQIHAAHGYLISQFLSPLANHREDGWGGSLDRRSRFLVEVVRAVRARVHRSFSVGVKLNAGDFQKGGFDIAEAALVVAKLETLGVDLVELSGGTYESPAMQGRVASGDVLTHGGYFVELARTIAARASIPIMVTGGITERDAAETALTPAPGGAAIAMVGIASALGFYPDLPREWRNDMVLAPEVPRAPWKSPVGNVANMEMVRVQLRRLGRGRRPGAWTSPLWALAAYLVRTALTTRRYRRWLGRRSAALPDPASSREARGLLPG